MLFALLLACVPDDVPGGKDSDTSTPDDSSNNQQDDSSNNQQDDSDNNQTEQSLVGSWRSEGDNVAPLLQASGVAWVDATFNANGSYTTQVGDTAGKNYNLAGSYTVDTSTLPGTIIATQTSPFSATAEGIWEVDGNTLTYEVAQTSPDNGFTPPTPDGGFGSTKGTNVEEGVNIQKYVRQ